MPPDERCSSGGCAGREAIVVDARVGDADHHPGGRARAEVDRAAPGRVGLAHPGCSTAPQPSPDSVDRCVALDVAHAGRRRAGAAARAPSPRLGSRTSARPSSRSSTETRAAGGSAPGGGAVAPGGSATTNGRSSAAAFTRRPPRAAPPRARARPARGARSRPSRSAESSATVRSSPDGHEQRVVAEAGAAARRTRELSLDPSLDDDLAPVGQRGRERAHERRRAIGRAVQAREQGRVAIGVGRPRPARRVEAGLAVQRRDLEARSRRPARCGRPPPPARRAP